MSLGIDPLIVDIPNFPNYQISTDGVVYNKITGREKKPSFDKDGYLFTRLWISGNGKNVKIHRLLAILFIPNPLNNNTVDHIDKNKQNNKLENLRWVTVSENATNCNRIPRGVSGVVGVCLKFINNREYKWVGCVIKNKKKYEKYFNHTDEGFNEAVKWRKDQKEKLHKIL